ncbi:MAG: LPS-assembly protein LptD, partial [SAR324 cluster bacterium]|nr:LPS-assembly protein LptD [SAR324 cluster bacterium]
ETQTRNGSFLDYRKAFSKRSSINSRFIYSNERPRDGDLRGTNIDGIYNPEIDDNRYGGYYKQRWSTEEDVLVPSSLVLDGRYVSDNLLLKEIDDNDIALQTSRYVTSTGVFRSALGDYFQSELMGEYNQAMLENQDLVFHREPEFIFSGFKSWRPLGYNMFGIKLITRGTLDVTEFKRDEYYQGQRLDFYPNISIPLRYKNYFNSQFDLGANITSYDLSNQTDPNDPAKIWDENPSRTVPNFSYKIGTGIERVYSVDNDSWLRDLTSFGVENQSTQLARVKHVIEPLIKYRYVPEVAQDDIAQFDQLDRIREKSLIVYGITNRFIGRFSPVRGAEDTIPELTPEVEDLPQPQISSLLDDLGGPRLTDDLAQPLRLKRGQIRELFNVSLLEGYNLLEARENQNPDRNAFTDLTGNITVNPTEYAGLGFTSTYDREHSKFSSWEATSRFRTDRGDSLLARYSFVAKEANSLAIKDISQLQGGAELVLSDRVRFGYFTRFDSPSGAFIDSIAALRLISACNCWHLDLEYVLQTNPDREKYLLSFTFGGLGSLTQAIPYTGYRQDSNQNTN